MVISHAPSFCWWLGCISLKHRAVISSPPGRVFFLSFLSLFPPLFFSFQNPRNPHLQPSNFVTVILAKRPASLPSLVGPLQLAVGSVCIADLQRKSVSIPQQINEKKKPPFFSLLLTYKNPFLWEYVQKKNSGDCTTVATQPRQLHYSNNFSKKNPKKCVVLFTMCSPFMISIGKPSNLFFLSKCTTNRGGLF